MSSTQGGLWELVCMSQVLLWRWGWADGAFDKTSTAQAKRSWAPRPLGWRPEPVLSQRSWQSWAAFSLYLERLKESVGSLSRIPLQKCSKETRFHTRLPAYYVRDCVYLGAPTSLSFTTFHILNRACTCFHWFWTRWTQDSRDYYNCLYWCTTRSFLTTFSLSTFKHGTDGLWDPDVLQEGQLKAPSLEAGPQGEGWARVGRPRRLSARTNCDPVGDNPARQNTEKTPADKLTFSPRGAFTCTDISVEQFSVTFNQLPFCKHAHLNNSNTKM